MAAECNVSDGGEREGSGLRLSINDPMRNGVRSLWTDDLFKDYKINVDNREFHVHKVIMAAMSDYFKAMLTGGLEEGRKDNVIIKGVSAAVMEILIEYIYENHMAISQANAADVLGGAVYFQMDSAIDICTGFIVDNLDVDNWFDVLTLFKSFGLRDAVQDVRHYACSIVKEILSTGKNKQLSYGDILHIARNWQGTEFDLFRFILPWLNADKADRMQYIEKLLCLVRFALMKPIELGAIKKILEESELDGDPAPWVSTIDKALQYQGLPIHQRVLDNSKQTKLRNPPSFVSFAKEDPNNPGHFYDPLYDKGFIKHERLITPIKGGMLYRQIEVNNFLVICTEDLEHIPVEVYWYLFDPRTMEWSPMAHPTGKAKGEIMTHDSNHLYAFNGDDYMEEVSGDIVRYDFQTDTWSDFGQLVKPSKCFSPCVFDNGLYVSGGILLDEGVFSRMDRLDLVTHEWESKAPMLWCRHSHTMYPMNILQGQFLCIIEEDWSIDYYCPKTDQWSTDKFCFNKPPPALKAKPWVRGNSVFISEDEQDGKRGEDRGLRCCVVVTFDKDWDEATVEFLRDSERRFAQSAFHTALAMPHHPGGSA